LVLVKERMFTVWWGFGQYRWRPEAGTKYWNEIAPPSALRVSSQEAKRCCVRADALVQEHEPPRSGAGIDTEAESLELIVELARAGLVSAEVGDDGTLHCTLTPTGQKVARQMAMCREPHALVLLGALYGSGEAPN
jgi:hypothetical protein